MLLEFNRGGGNARRSILVQTDDIVAMFGSRDDADTSILRMDDGRGFLVRGNVAWMQQTFPDMFNGLTELQRALTDTYGVPDDASAEPLFIRASKLSVLVASSSNPGESIVRVGSSGKGFRVRGGYEEVKAKLFGVPGEPMLAISAPADPEASATAASQHAAIAAGSDWPDNGEEE